MPRGGLLLTLPLWIASGCGNTVIVEGRPAATGGCDEPPCVGVERGETLGACPCDGPVTEVSDAAALEEALTSTGCIALGAGHYGDVEVPSGAQLRGADYRDVIFDTLRFDEDAIASACRLSALGVEARPGATATLQYVHLRSGDDGVIVGDDATLTVVGSTIENMGRFAINAHQARGLRVIGTAIRNTAAGVWAQCRSETELACDCPQTMALELDRVWIGDVAHFGVVAYGAEVRFDDVAVRRVDVGPNFEGGSGVVIGECSDGDVRGLRVEDSTSVGAMVYRSRARLSDVTVAQNLIGLWLQPLAHEVSVEQLRADDNLGIGLGFSGGPQDGPVTVRDGDIDGTSLVKLPVVVNGISAGVEEVGDGISWRDGIVADLESIRVRSSARHDVFIRGSAAGSLHDLSVEDPYVVQECGAMSPTVSGTTPPISSTCP